jgi:hypothetical protein
MQAHEKARVKKRRGAHAHVALALAAAGLIGTGTTSLVAAHDPDWDQVANIKEAALHLAQLQKTQGASKAFTFIDACYRTHSLSSDYTKAFEACIAQDYLETQILSIIYARVPPDALKRMGAPSPDVLATTMTHRVGAAFAQYKVPKERIAEFKRNIDEHGFPLFFATLFPGTQTPVPKDLIPSTSPDAATPAPDGQPAPEKK